MARRVFTVVLAAAAISGLLVACGDDDPTGDASTGTGSEATDGAAGPGTTHGGAGASSGDARHVEVDARSFAFEPSEITVAAGEDVALVLASEDGDHDFTVDELDAQVVAAAAEQGFGMFQAGEPGRYAFYCSVEGHREAGMEGVLVVEG